MICKYCKPYKALVFGFYASPIKNEITNNGKGSLIYSEKDKAWAFYTENKDNYVNIQNSFIVNFCPMCGRKLNKE